MITAPLMFVTQGVVIDAKDGLISAYNILENVEANKFPVMFQASNL